MEKKISCIIPFYKGNDCIARALGSISRIQRVIENESQIEVIIVNDSPEVKVELPEINLDCRVITHQKNCGIHKSRIDGINEATGELIQFLDQDDELVSEGYKEQLSYIQCCDVVVGNGYYQLGGKDCDIFSSLSSMKYLVSYEKLIKIRNLIPSPGECLIRKSSIPDEWLRHALTIDGADDWMLWITMFKNGAQFLCNPLKVYIHNDVNGTNLSTDLRRMRDSAHEANRVLRGLGAMTDKESDIWERAIEFKYLQDTRQLSITDLIKYRREIWNNIIYKLNVYVRDRIELKR